MTPLYYEAHVTLHPEFDENRLRYLDATAALSEFRRAKLLMVRGNDKNIAYEDSKKDLFLSARDGDYATITQKTNRVVADLRARGFQVLRAKIEAALMDTKFGLSGHEFFVTNAETSPSSSNLVETGNDEDAKFWRLVERADSTLTLRLHYSTPSTRREIMRAYAITGAVTWKNSGS